VVDRELGMLAFGVVDVGILVGEFAGVYSSVLDLACRSGSSSSAEHGPAAGLAAGPA